MNETAALISKYGIRASKSLSQNFLADEHVIKKIADCAGIGENTAALEIGGGLGSLTKELLKRAGSVTVIELDRRMCEILSAEYGCERLEIINADVMKTDISALAARKRSEGYDVKVCANLPYHLTSPVIVRLLSETEGLSLLTLMMQKEVAQRIMAQPGTKSYGSLTPFVGYYAETSLVANVPPNCFIPRPDVHSAVLNFNILDKKPVSPSDEQLMFAVIRAAFGQRRKTLFNALSNQLAPKIGISKTELSECFDKLAEYAITPNIRGETLGLAEFALVSDVIAEKCLRLRQNGNKSN